MEHYIPAAAVTVCIQQKWDIYVLCSKCSHHGVVAAALLKLYVSFSFLGQTISPYDGD